MSVNGRRFDAVLFDWDDTLAYAEPHRYVHGQAVARQFGHELSLRAVHEAFVRAGDSYVGGWEAFIRRLPVELGVAEQHHAAFLEAYRARDTFKRFQLYDDVLELIEHLGRRALRVGLISNNVDLDRYVDLLEARQHFEVVVSPLTWGVGKPDPEIFRRALAEMAVPAARALYVGDSYDNDVVGARAAGLTPVLLDRFEIQLDGHDAEHRVIDFAALAELLDRLLQD
jgi:HAD superfamily hydrolase (TIGR01549 family)